MPIKSNHLSEVLTIALLVENKAKKPLGLIRYNIRLSQKSSLKTSIMALRSHEHSYFHN
jgi:hypothetical protein